MVLPVNFAYLKLILHSLAFITMSKNSLYLHFVVFSIETWRKCKENDSASFSGIYDEGTHEYMINIF